MGVSSTVAYFAAEAARAHMVGGSGHAWSVSAPDCVLITARSHCAGTAVGHRHALTELCGPGVALAAARGFVFMKSAGQIAPNARHANPIQRARKSRNLVLTHAAVDNAATAPAQARFVCMVAGDTIVERAAVRVDVCTTSEEQGVSFAVLTYTSGASMGSTTAVV